MNGAAHRRREHFRRRERVSEIDDHESRRGRSPRIDRKKRVQSPVHPLDLGGMHARIGQSCGVARKQERLHGIREIIDHDRAAGHFSGDDEEPAVIAGLNVPESRGMCDDEGVEQDWYVRRHIPDLDGVAASGPTSPRRGVGEAASDPDLAGVSLVNRSVSQNGQNRGLRRRWHDRVVGAREQCGKRNRRRASDSKSTRPSAERCGVRQVHLVFVGRRDFVVSCHTPFPWNGCAVSAHAGVGHPETEPDTER